MARRNLERLKGKAPQLLLMAVVVVVIVLVLLDTLEDTMIERGGFSGTPFALLLNAIVMLTESVTATVSSWGYAGIFFLMLLESSSLPIPSEVILPFSGYLVSLDQLNLWLTILVSTLAGITGSMVEYYVGMKRMDLLARQKTHVLFSKARMETAERWFNKYDALMVFLSRLIPGSRALVSFPAGAVKMPLQKFVAYTTAGCLVGNAFLTCVGEYVGASWREVAGVSHYLIIGFLAAFLVALAWFLIERRRRTWKARKGARG